MNAKDRPVKGPNGRYGTVDTTCWPNLPDVVQTEVDVQLNDGSHVTLPAETLIEQKDGSYYVPLKQEQLNAIPHHPQPHADGEPSSPCREREK